MTAPAYSHVHSGLASAHFDIADAVWSESRKGEVWAIYLDASLSRWEVFVDAVHGRVFTSNDTWQSLDGPSRVAFLDDFVRAYKGSEKRELRVLADEVYQAGARRRAAKEGTAVTAGVDRIADLQRRATEAVVAVAGMNNGAPSALQLQVFAVRHAQIAEDLAALEADMERLRSAVSLSASALHRAFG